MLNIQSSAAVVCELQFITLVCPLVSRKINSSYEQLKNFKKSTLNERLVTI